MDPKYDDDGMDLDESTRRIRILAERSGDLTFRQSIAGGFEKVNDRLGKIDTRLARIEERQIPRKDVAEIARTEFRADMEKLTAKYENLARIVYGLAGVAGSAIVGLAVEKVFGR